MRLLALMNGRSSGTRLIAGGDRCNLMAAAGRPLAERQHSVQRPEEYPSP